MTSRSASAPDVATRPVHAPEPGQASAAELTDQVRECRQRLIERRNALEDAKKPRPGRNDEQRLKDRRERELLEDRIADEEAELQAVERQLAGAKKREADEAAKAIAPTLPDRFRARVSRIGELEAELKSEVALLGADLKRVWDGPVRRELERLGIDPTTGLRPQLRKLLPTDGRLLDLGDGPLMGPRRWPALVQEGDRTYYKDLDLIATQADFEVWAAQGHQPIPGGSEAARQRGELASRFARRFVQ